MTEETASNENPALQERIRAAFEEGAGIDAAGLAALADAAGQATRRRRIRRLVCRWGAAALLAASVAAAFCFRALTTTPACGTNGLDAAICLLCEIDGLSTGEMAGLSAGEMLLAWQDAPCMDIL